MINKFKDFLKKLSRKRNSDFSDQDELLDDGISDDDLQPGFNEEDRTGETPLPDLKPSWKDRIKSSVTSLRKKKNVADAEDSLIEDSDEMTPVDEYDRTGETPLPLLKPSWKDRLSGSFAGMSGALSGLRSKFSKAKVREMKLPDGMKKKSGESNLMTLSPSLTKSIEKFLSKDARDSIHQVSLVFLICAFTYTLGKLAALSLKGAPAIDTAKDYTVNLEIDEDFNPQTLGQVRSINIFRTNTGLSRTKRVADARCDEAQGTSNLPIKLLNTIVLQDNVKSLASVQVRGDRDLQEVRVGDQISNLAKIFKITRPEILVRNLESGLCESIASDKLNDSRRSPISVMSPAQSKKFVANKKMPGIENEGNKFKISKTLLDEKMKDIAAILTQARAIKIQNPDGTMAFKLTEMDPQGIFPYLGLQDQDIITSINGKPIYDMDEVMSLFARIKNLDKLQLELSETELNQF